MQKACYLRTRTCQLQKTLTMLIEERYKDEDTGSDDVNSLPKLEHLIQPMSVFSY